MQHKFEKAVALHRKGRLAEAKAIYQRILKQAPKNADALHLLGVVAAQTNDFARSVELIGRALEVRPDDAAFHSNLGNALRALGRAEADAVVPGNADDDLLRCGRRRCKHDGNRRGCERPDAMLRRRVRQSCSHPISPRRTLSLDKF